MSALFLFNDFWPFFRFVQIKVPKFLHVAFCLDKEHKLFFPLM